MRFDMIVKGGSVVTPGEGVMRADVAVRGGKVAALIDDASGAEADDVYDASGLHVFPGVVDPHVHIGLAEGLDDWETETRSAAVGGVTTALTYLMAGTSYGPIVEANLDRAARDSVVDYGFHLVPSAPVHLDEMDEHAERYGIKSYKYFTSFRGDEGAYLGISGTDDGFMYRYFDQVAKLPGGVANVHPENIEVVWELRKRLLAEGRDDLKAWDESRPDFVEAQSAVAAAFYAHVTGCPLYIVHVSGRLALNELRAARERYGGAPLHIETCPHFLTHHSGMEIGPLGKVNPAAALRGRRGGAVGRPRATAPSTPWAPITSPARRGGKRAASGRAAPASPEARRSSPPCSARATTGAAFLSNASPS